MKNISVEEFYKDVGKKLIEENNYPREIESFLDKEVMAIGDVLLQRNYNYLIECGCMQGRYLPILDKIDNIKYLGIDIVDTFIEQARYNISVFSDTKRASAVQVAAEDLIVKNYIEPFEPEKILCFFPFNSFGNTSQPKKILKNFQEQNLSFSISTYKNNIESTSVRHQYYNNCGYKNIVMKSTQFGTIFASDDGLNSISYSLSFFEENLFQNYSIKTTHFNDIGVLFTMRPNIFL